MKIEVDTIFPQVRVDGQILPLTKKEFDVLSFLWANKGRTCTRDIIFDRVWQFEECSDRMVDITVHRIRKKYKLLGKVIYTKKGFGYSLKV